MWVLERRGCRMWVQGLGCLTDSRAGVHSCPGGPAKKVFVRMPTLKDAENCLHPSCPPRPAPLCRRHQDEINKLWQRRGERAKRWDAAFRVLHAELAAAKARMGEFVASFQQHAQQGAEQQAQQQQQHSSPAVPVQ